MNNKITFPELVKLVAEATSTTPRMSELFLKELFATISQALIEGESVTIKKLGTFESAPVAARKSVNVNTGEQIEIPIHNKIIFTPDKALARAINQPFSSFENITLSDDMTDDMLRDIDQSANTTTSASSVPETESSVEPDSELDTASPTTEPDNTPPAPISAAISSPPPFMPKSTTPPETAWATEPQEPELVVEHSVQHYSLAEFERTKRTIAKHSFLKGMLAGAVAMLALCAISWCAWNNHTPVQTIPTMAETIAEDDAPVKPIITNSQHEESAERQSAIGLQPPHTPKVVTDTCTATLYLSKMSRKHYGKPDFWIYIYEENRDKISDPNNVTPGTVVVVPPASKYGINPNDKASIDRARKRTYELLSAN